MPPAVATAPQSLSGRDLCPTDAERYPSAPNNAALLNEPLTIGLRRNGGSFRRLRSERLRAWRSILRDIGPQNYLFGAVIGMTGEQGYGAIDLLQQHDPHELV